MSMDQDLARMFGTDKVASNQKMAALDHFAKVASVAGIDFESDQQAAAWVDTWGTFQKMAYDNNIPLHEYGVGAQAEMFMDWVNRSYGGGEQQKVAEAAHYLNKIAHETASVQQQFQAAVQFGKIAAHAYVSELSGGMRKRADGKGIADEDRQLSLPFDDEPKKPQPKSAPEPAKAAPAKAPESAAEEPGRWQRFKDSTSKHYNTAKDKAKELWAHKHRNKALGSAGALALAGGLLYAGKKIYDKKKQEGEGKEAFDLLAAKEAHALLVSEGYDPNESAHRLNLALQKEALEPTSYDVKIAAAQDPEYGLLTRAVELMELAGYEVG